MLVDGAIDHFESSSCRGTSRRPHVITMQPKRTFIAAISVIMLRLAIFVKIFVNFCSIGVRVYGSTPYGCMGAFHGQPLRKSARELCANDTNEHAPV